MKEFALICAASLLGAAVHGFDLPVPVHRCVWTVLFALLYALADGVSALATMIAGCYGPGSRAASLIPASAMLGVSLFLHWSGRYGQDLIPFSAYSFAVVASSVLLLARHVPWGPAGGKTAALAVLTAGSVAATAFFDRHPFRLFGFLVDGSVVSHLLDALALLLLLDLAVCTVRKADGEEGPPELDLELLQPSQFLISRHKLDEVEKWFRPDDLSGFEPIPVKTLDGVPVMTDGHTRAVAALRAGLKRVPLEWEKDSLDWEMYRRCVEECRKRGVRSLADLTERVVCGEEYAREWDGWCDRMQAEVLAERK